MSAGKGKAFTLVEMVVVIAIIGLLLSIVLPAYNEIKLATKKAKDVSNLKKIAEAWRECAINRGWTIDGIERKGSLGSSDYDSLKVTVFAEQLSGLGKTNISDMVLNDANVYISFGDKYASKLNHEMVVYIDTGSTDTTGKYTIEYTGQDIGNSGSGLTKGAFAKTSSFMTTGSQFISYCFMCNLPAGAPLETTPLGFTRGLCENGTWDERSGLYGSIGGYVVYCDGHVNWFDGSRPARFLRWDGAGYSSDIRNAVPDTVSITCGNSGTNPNLRNSSDTSLVLLYYRGKHGVNPVKDYSK